MLDSWVAYVRLADAFAATSRAHEGGDTDLWRAFPPAWVWGHVTEEDDHYESPTGALGSGGYLMSKSTVEHTECTVPVYPNVHDVIIVLAFVKRYLCRHGSLRML